LCTALRTVPLALPAAPQTAPMLDWLALATYTLVMSITPGPNNAMLLASGARFGFARTLPHMLGISVGFALQTALVCAAFGIVQPWIAGGQAALSWIGIAYMGWLAWRLLRAGPVGSADGGVQPLAAWQSALFQWLNPKAWVMALTVASVFLPAGADLRIALAGIALVLTLVNLPCVALWAAFGTALRGWLAGARRRLAFNLLMAGLLAWTAWGMSCAAMPG
jgi:threonine/homoserine/homoserine lactone efflux protein